MSRRNLGEYVGPLLAAAIVVSAAGVVAGGTGGGGASADSPTRISSCTKITEPGQYVLTNDLKKGAGTPCLVINSDDVTLDGRNHSVTQPKASSVAVRITGVDVTVRNLFVTGGVEYNTGEGSTSQLSASGGELFVDAHRETIDGTTIVNKTVRVTDESSVSSSSGSFSSSSSSSSVSVSSSSSSSSVSSSSSTDLTVGPLALSASEAIPDELLDDGTLPSICGFKQNEENKERDE